jgi:hypothetical protein
MGHRIDDELRKIGVSYKRAGRVEDQDDPVLSGPLRLDEIAEGIELEIGGKDAGHFASQGCADRDHRYAEAERKIRRQNPRPVGFQRLAIPAPCSRVVSVFPEIELSDFVALLIFKDSPHGQFATGGGTDQIDRNVSARRRTQRPALLIVEFAGAPYLQPGAIFESSIDAVHLRQFLQRGLE